MWHYIQPAHCNIAKHKKPIKQFICITYHAMHVDNEFWELREGVVFLYIAVC